jgi:hypothetical protein
MSFRFFPFLLTLFSIRNLDSTLFTMAAGFFRRWLLRPSLWTCIVAILAYCDDKSLHGKFVYDDAGSVKKNVVVNGQAPLAEVWTRDFWGTPMSQSQSHKSFRPVTTLTFRWNQVLAERLGTNETADHTYGFHLVNVGLHGVVTGLVTESAAFVFVDCQESDLIAQLITGFVFGLHPVHAEAVSNITSRGELLMSLFFLLGFLSFASHLPNNKTTKTKVSSSRTRTTLLSRFRSLLFIYIIPWICMTLSLFSKEQGATTLISLVIYDFIQHHGSVIHYLRTLFAREAESIAFLRRTIILAMQTLAVCALRYWLNGETSPDFISDQNPAGFAEDRFTRVFSVGWVYCLYIWDALYPRYLCPDWSGISIPLIEHWTQDKRSVGVVALWMFAAACLGSLIEGPPENTPRRFKEGRRIVLLAFFAFMFSPFLLSSNLLVVVGLMKADRVIYLPLLGFCILEALFLKTVFSSSDSSSLQHDVPQKYKDHVTPKRSKLSIQGHLLVMVQLMLFAGKVHERNVAWSDPMSLWASSYQVNPISRHTIYNCGYELSLRQRYEEAEEVLRPIGSARVEGPSNTFVYSMVLFNLKRCEEANQYLDEAFQVLEEKRAQGGTRYTPSTVARLESNLLVARAYCAEDIAQTGQIMYSAVEKDPTNDYALQQAMAILQKVENANMMQQNQVGMGRQ